MATAEDFIVSLLASASFSAVLCGALFWLFRSWVGERIRGSIRHEYEQKLETFKSQLQESAETHKAQLRATSEVELERLKSHLAIAASERSVRYARLHEKRAEVIAKLHRLLTDIRGEFAVMVSPATNPAERRERFVTTHQLWVEIFQYFEHHKIYLPAQTCDLIAHFIRDIRKTAVSFDIKVNAITAITQSDEAKFKEWAKAAAYSDEEIPKLLAPLELDFRRLLGEESPQSSTP